MASQVEGRVKEVIVVSRINKVLAMRTDSVAMLEALDAISEFYVTNTVEARRSLRQDLESQNISLAKKFLEELDNVKERIESVEESSIRLESTCNTVAKQIADTNENMRRFMEKATSLENNRNFYLRQSKEIKSLLDRFQLSNEEIDILHTAPIDKPKSAKQFFEALQRLRVAYDDCKSMVEQHSYSSGFELLEVLGQHQDAAYQRLFDWVKTQCDMLAESTSTDDIDILLQIAIRYLRKLPIYFSQCQDLIVTSRRSHLVQRFVIALTQGVEGGPIYRAIDLHVHDAVRYVGDMLAWMHQTIASEEEFLNAVFGPHLKKKSAEMNESIKVRSIITDKSLSRNGSDYKFETQIESGDDVIGLSVPDLLARCLQGLGRPLRVRISQTLESRASLEELYVLTDLLSFYENTFSNLVKVENAVHSTVKGCLLECKRLFISQLNKQSESLVQSPVTYPMDLSSSHMAKECCRQVRAVLRVYYGALSPLPSLKDDPCHVDNVLGSIIQPLLQSCRLSCQTLPPGEMAIFMLNNVYTVQVRSEYSDKSNALVTNILFGTNRLV
jgi:hypothetical protein